MTKTNQSQAGDGDEVEAFMAQYPDFSAIDLLVFDQSGCARGKRMPVEKLRSVFEEGIRLPGSVFALDITGASVEATGLIWEDGDADRVCRPVSGTLAPAPWLQPPAGQLVLTMYEEDGRPFYGDPRHALDNVLARYRARGWTVVAAPELEFYVTDLERDATGRPRMPAPPGRPEREEAVQVYDMNTVADYNALLAEIYGACDVQRLPIEGTIAEYAPGQLEVNLTHVPDAMRAATDALLLKRIIKGVATRHGYDATFMAKPFIEHSGNGFHIHFSVLDEDGRNIFDNGGDEGSELLRFAIGGLRKAMAEGMLLFAPNINSYRRFQENSYAPMAPTWGYNNRTVALRVPGGPPEARRIEHRVAGADANPFTLLAAILASALYGIEHEIDPGPPIEGNAYEQAVRSLPAYLPQALELFERSELFPQYLGPEFCRLYAICKREEYEKFSAYVTGRELSWYFRTA